LHPTLLPFAKDFADKQRAYQEAWRRLDEHSAIYERTDSSSPSFYSVADTQQQLWDSLSTAYREMEASSIAMQSRAMDLAGYPADDPLRLRLLKRSAP
jgi:hypothetical protein